MKISLSALLLLFAITVVQSQILPVKIEKSSQIIRYQGQDYYIHTVKAGHTLYSICHAYGVTEEEIRAANPGISFSPLSIGVVLKIPVIKNKGKTETTDDGAFILHRVRPRETPYFLHKKYNVPLEIIYQYNPGAEEGLQIGQVVRIPKNYTAQPNQYRPQVIEYPDTAKEESRTQPSEPVQAYKNYRVKAGDTLYRISMDFGIRISDLITVNPELRWGLKEGQLIRIPTVPLDHGEMAWLPPDSVLSVMNFEKLSRYQCDSIRSLKRMPPPVKLVLMLPFFARDALEPQLSAIDSVTGEKMPPKKRRLKGRVAAEFYEGFLLAVDSLRKKGINISLFVYDTEGDTNRTKQILKDLEIVEPDVIIGPLSPPNISLVSRFSFERKIPFVPPLATDHYLFRDNPYMFRTIPTSSDELKTISEYLAKRAVDKNFILVYKNSMKYQADVDSFKQYFIRDLAANPMADTLRLTEIFINDSLSTHLDSAIMKSTKENLVFVFSSFEPDVINALSRLHFLLREREIKVYGMPAWQKFENVRIDVMHDLGVTLHSPFYIDYEDKEVQDFVRKCRSTLKYEPYMTTSKGSGINYAYLGYDLAFYFIQNTTRYGNNLCGCTDFTGKGYLLSDYTFERNLLTGNLENTCFSLLYYREDYVVKRVTRTSLRSAEENKYP